MVTTGARDLGLENGRDAEDARLEQYRLAASAMAAHEGLRRAFAHALAPALLRAPTEGGTGCRHRVQLAVGALANCTMVLALAAVVATLTMAAVSYETTEVVRVFATPCSGVWSGNATARCPALAGVHCPHADADLQPRSPIQPLIALYTHAHPENAPQAAFVLPGTVSCAPVAASVFVHAGWARRRVSASQWDAAADTLHDNVQGESEGIGGVAVPAALYRDLVASTAGRSLVTVAGGSATAPTQALYWSSTTLRMSAIGTGASPILDTLFTYLSGGIAAVVALLLGFVALFLAYSTVKTLPADARAALGCASVRAADVEMDEWVTGRKRLAAFLAQEAVVLCLLAWAMPTFILDTASPVAIAAHVPFTLNVLNFARLPQVLATAVVIAMFAAGAIVVMLSFLTSCRSASPHRDATTFQCICASLVLKPVAALLCASCTLAAFAAGASFVFFAGSRLVVAAVAAHMVASAFAFAISPRPVLWLVSVPVLGRVFYSRWGPAPPAGLLPLLG